ncbi:MAG: hypothetical protein ACE5HV_02195 [Acidobacteriota bacterium]
MTSTGIAGCNEWEPDHISGICVVAVDDPGAVVQELKRRGVIVSTRGEGIRVSCHFYNNFEEIDRFIEELASIAG